MGLDMYLEGHKYFWPDFKNHKNDRSEDEYRVSDITLDLGYWRKHPNLHGYIVKQFADGVDECQEIELDAVAIRDIIDAVKRNRLPATEGPFFGRSDGSEREEDIRIFERALLWLGNSAAKQPKLEQVAYDDGVSIHEVIVPDVMPRESRTVIYRASW